jgi:ABC-type dipeptide/oligopeptide/nickel transport system ATPase component
VLIAGAMALHPKLLLADEPVASLDASIRGEILALMRSYVDRDGISIIAVTHDLGLAWNIADRVAVMYLGRIVETGPADVLYSNPQHPYTQALLSAVPIPDPTIELGRQRIVLQGDLPSPIDPPSGCRFRTRCWRADERCATEQPTLTAVQGAHEVACHYPGAETAVSVSGGAR